MKIAIELFGYSFAIFGSKIPKDQSAKLVDQTSNLKTCEAKCSPGSMADLKTIPLRGPWECSRCGRVYESMDQYTHGLNNEKLCLECVKAKRILNDHGGGIA